ncbi:TPT domain-containing protein [Mycena sanguinolenta]|uniref:TPT domain-containing protein n=1 Tax=Mycena sanguinolenta TaxID=230812 RepID=A0A8H6XEQ8_9AGAR|nr:TPT domain-containing protein [Mycena sanguinolenta]
MPGTLQVAGVVAFYMCSALVMVFVNKAVLISAPDLPLVFLLLQLIIAVVLLKLSALFSRGAIEIPPFDSDSAKKLFPVVFVNIVGLVFNTLCLRGVDASFFQIARGLVLPLTIIVSSVHTRSMPSANVILASVIVTGGFFLGVAPSSKVPITANPFAFVSFYGFLSSLFIAFHAVLIKMSLPYCNNSSIQLAWWTNAGSAVMLLPAVVLAGEISTLRDMVADPHWDATVFLWGTLVTGFFGFLLCIAGLLSIRVTSPITHMFSSAARSVLQTVIGVTYFGDLITTYVFLDLLPTALTKKISNRATSIIVILGGTMSVFPTLQPFDYGTYSEFGRFYTWIKAVETPTATPPRHTSDIEKGGEKVELEDMSEEIVFQVPEDKD